MKRVEHGYEINGAFIPFRDRIRVIMFLTENEG